jgi:hypothetical protein
MVKLQILLVPLQFILTCIWYIGVLILIYWLALLPNKSLPITFSSCLSPSFLSLKFSNGFHPLQLSSHCFYLTLKSSDHRSHLLQKRIPCYTSSSPTIEVTSHHAMNAFIHNIQPCHGKDKSIWRAKIFREGETGRAGRKESEE